MAVERIIGVDFGTSTSVIRVKRYENGTYVGEKLETKDVVFNNTPITPTLVQINKDDPSKKPYFGYEAQQYRKDYDDFHSFKMDLESADPEAKARARELTKSFYGYLAQEYKSQSDGGHLGDHEDKKRTIISYPVKWSEETKTFMLETAKKSGFPNVSGMDEAQAAIQAVTVMSADHLKKHGLLTAGQSATILLIDMGAGTTDLVLARYTPGEKPKTEVLNTWPRGGDLHFGGREIDDLLPGYFRELLLEELPPKTVEKVLRIPADQYKSWKELTVSPDLARNESVDTFSALDQRLAFVDMELDFTLDREAFEACLSGYLPQFPALVKGCLEDAGVPGSDVDLVIVTGGHSQWYFVNDMLTGKLTRFGEMGLTKIQKNPARIVPISRPQETVALGLAYSGLPVEVVTPSPDMGGYEDFVNTIHGIINKKTDDCGFRLKLDPNSNPLFFNGAAVVFGTVETGSVKVGDTVWVHGGPGDGKYVQVKNIAYQNENVPSAKAGGEIAIQLLGISYKEAEAITHITGEAANPVDPPDPPVNGSFRLKLVPENKAFPAGGGTIMVVGTVLQGQVKVGDTVFVCGGPGQSQRVQVQKIVNRRDGTAITSAGEGAFVMVQLSGISEAKASCATYLAELPDDHICVEPPKPTDSVEELVRNVIEAQLDMDPVTKMLKKLFSNEESHVKLRSFLKVPADEPTLMAKDCTVFSTGKNGTVVTPRGIYICETYGQPYYISWQSFASGELTLEPTQGTIYLTDGSGNRKAAGYFLGETSTTAIFRVYQSLQEKLREYWGIQPPPGPEPLKFTDPVEELVQNFVQNYPKSLLQKFHNPKMDSIPKLRDFLKVPASEPTLVAMDCTVFLTGKNGTVITPGGIYICETFGQPYFVSWHQFVSGELSLEPKQSTIYLTLGAKVRKAVGYFLGEERVTPAFTFYKGLQRVLKNHTELVKPEPVKPKPVTPTPPPQPVTPTPGGSKPPIKSILDKIDEERKKKMENTLRWMESVERDAHTIPYAPESEFEIGSTPGNNCTIRKYKGSRSIVSIPPVIRGHRVVAIEDKAFGGLFVNQGNKTLEALIIPSSIGEIGTRAFIGCENLKIVIAHRMIHTIGDAAFFGCNTLLKMDFGMGPCEVGRLHLPPALQNIGANALTKYVYTGTSECIFKEITMSKQTKVKNPLGAKTFDPKYCAVFYY